jgi:zinc/manganese transport system substrate-binding protein
MEATRMKRWILLGLCLLVVGAGFFWLQSSRPVDATPAVPAMNKLKIVSTFSILTDFIQQVGGDKVHITTIVGPNEDVHVYEPKPSDLEHIQHADMVIINDLGFETWISRLLKSSKYRGPMVIATQSIHPRLVLEHTLMQDPHAWNSAANAKIYVHNILEALVQLDPDNKDYYTQRAGAYLQQLTALDGKIRAAIDAVPPHKRKIITAHDAFGYFGNAYNVQFFAPRGISTEAEPRAKDVAKLIEQIRKFGFKTIFLENIVNPKQLEQIAKEGGAKLGDVLYSDALSEASGPAATYIQMMGHNVALLVAAMQELG